MDSQYYMSVEAGLIGMRAQQMFKSSKVPGPRGRMQCCVGSIGGHSLPMTSSWRNWRCGRQRPRRRMQPHWSARALGNALAALAISLSDHQWYAVSQEVAQLRDNPVRLLQESQDSSDWLSLVRLFCGTLLCGAANPCHIVLAVMKLVFILTLQVRE